MGSAPATEIDANKHIAFLCPSLAIGGAERMLRRYANALAEHHYKVTIIVSGSDTTIAEQFDAGISIKVMHGKFRNPFLWWRIGALLKRLNPDVVVGWTTYNNFIAAMTRLVFRPRRTVVVELNYPPTAGKHMPMAARLFVRAMIRILFPLAHTVTANSDEALEVLRRWAPGAKRFRRLYNMLDFAQFDALASEPIPDRDRFCGRTTVYAIGRLDIPHKGLDILVKACAKLKDIPSWELVFVGGGTDRPILETLAAEYGIADRTHFLGPRQNPMPYFKTADIVALPSRFEGLPNALIEAMALGRATVAADCLAGPREITDNGRYGLLVPVEDIDALAETLRRLIGDEALRRRIGETARPYIRALYSHQSAFEALLEALA